MSKLLAAGEAVESVQRFKRIVEELGSRAARLNETFNTEQARERRRYEATLDEQKRQAALDLANAEAHFQTEKQRALADLERRKARIGRAYQSSKEQRLRKVDDQVGARKYELQKKMLQAERGRDAALVAAGSNFEEFKRHLAAEHEALAVLEREAQKAFKGYRGFKRAFFQAYEKADHSLSTDQHQLIASLREQITSATEELSRWRHFLLVRVFRNLPFWLVVVLCPAVLVPALHHFGRSSLTYPEAGAAVMGIAVAVLGLRFAAYARGIGLARSISNTLARARHLHDAAQKQAEVHHHEDLERLKAEFAGASQTADQELKQAHARAGELRVAARMKSDERTVQLNQRNEANSRARQQRLEHQHAESIKQLKESAQTSARNLGEEWDRKQQQLTGTRDSGLAALEVEWRNQLEPLWDTFKTAETAAQDLFPSWDSPGWKQWKPPAEFAQGAKFAKLEVDLARLCEARPEEMGLKLPGARQFPVPLCLTYPEQGSILIETADWGHDQAIGALNNVILRLLASAPPGRLNFTILDPVGLGQNFAGVMHLADYEEQIINNRIWTQSTQIEEKLGELNEHMEKVIQMYLRNEYKTIAEYNEQAGVIAEKYHFLVVADFPANFSDNAAKRLLSIAASGGRCGVYMLIHWDRRQPLPQDFIPEELRKSAFCLKAQGSLFVNATGAIPGAELILDPPPSSEQAIEFVNLVGRESRDSSRVEVPFEHVAPSEGEIWTEETTTELRVPIGRTGATKFQYLAIGKGTCQHGLVAGKTGSGKSTLFHVIITNLALWCSPEEVEFYLVDFKKGVEFKCYAAKQLPHARVVAIESDREFGLSVLQRLDEELKRRGDLFRQASVQDLGGYKRAGGREKVPRTLLLIDEFQEFFVEDDKIAQTASLLLDRIVRQGRAFGIHVLLGSQTLGGAYTVARTTLGQMVIRVALQCNEADAYLIMDENNPAPRLLSRPGEGIYNDMAGALEGNSPFQVVWLPESVRDQYLSKIRQHADQNGQHYPGPIIFEGNAPADVRENPALRSVLSAQQIKPGGAGRIWMGAPNSIKGPTEAVFERQSGNNLLIVGQRDEAILAIFSIGLLGLAAQYKPAGARLILCDASPPDSPQRAYLEKVIAAAPNSIRLAKPGELGELMKELGAEMNQRREAIDPNAPPPIYLFIHGLQNFGKLRYEEDFSFSSSESTEANPGALFNELVCEGARLGIHVIAACETYNNVSRFLSRKALSEFEMRVLFQMSVNDSASLIDSPKAGLLGLHRALFYNAQEGYLETFRPYSLPPLEWVAETAANLSRLHHP